MGFDLVGLGWGEVGLGSGLRKLSCSLVSEKNIVGDGGEPGLIVRLGVAGKLVPLYERELEAAPGGQEGVGWGEVRVASLVGC
jgi:hypothetical protein